MAITATSYNGFLMDLGRAVHSFYYDEVIVSLITSAYTPDLTTDEDFPSTAGVHEIDTNDPSTNYTRYNLFNKDWIFDSVNNCAKFVADPAFFGNITATFRYAVIWRSNPSNAALDNRLIGLLDFGTDQVHTAEDLEIPFPDGVVAIAAGTATP